MTARNGAAESDVLNRVTVRLMSADELGRFNYHLQEDHYLESSRLAGQSLRYVAEVDGRWVALLTFSAPALHLKARERWIGWSPRQRARRLGLVVNNSRFLVLLERQRYPNLASRVLGLVLRRLSADWQEQWSHPVLVVESFVDESLYRGTCYRACGFEAVGPTAVSAGPAATSIRNTAGPNSFTCANCAGAPAGVCGRPDCPRSWVLMKPR